ncbi:MAG: hypothetical protein KAW12_20715 [Candidatus Aminicenantes bacterium]|nr:hypothetical protein [Candidatus Aminicenantes bacterium]
MNIVKKVFILFLLITLLGCTSDQGFYSDVVVVDCKYPQFFSGVIITWLKITIELKDSTKYYVYYPYIYGEKFPIIGKKYDIYYKIEDLNGPFDWNKEIKIKDAKIVEKYVKKN